MGRKRKTLFVSAILFVALFAAAFWRQQFSGEVRMIYAGAPANDSSLVSFSITNSFRRPIVYSIEGAEAIHGGWQTNGHRFWYSNYTGRVTARSAEIVSVKVDSLNHWRCVVVYRDSWMPSFVVLTRARLATYSAGLGWKRLSQSLRPTQRLDHVPGPEMVGNQPTGPA
jgi:hypothetical protein